jgi:hypothetical protein
VGLEHQLTIPSHYWYKATKQPSLLFSRVANFLTSQGLVFSLSLQPCSLLLLRIPTTNSHSRTSLHASSLTPRILCLGRHSGTASVRARDARRFGSETLDGDASLCVEGAAADIGGWEGDGGGVAGVGGEKCGRDRGGGGGACCGSLGEGDGEGTVVPL